MPTPLRSPLPSLPLGGRAPQAPCHPAQSLCALSLCALSFCAAPLVAGAQPTPELTPAPAPAPAPPSRPSRPEVWRSSPFSGERALLDLRRYAARGHRYYGAPEREEVVQELSRDLSALGALVVTQRFEVTERGSGARYTLTNLVGRLWPERPRRVLLGTHWDTRLWAEEDAEEGRRGAPIVGANDGTSGLAVLLELGRLLKERPLAGLGVDVVLFDGEELGRPGSDDYCAGSRHLAARLSELYAPPMEGAPAAVVVLDMVGDAELTLPPERSSLQTSRALTQLVWQEASRQGAGAFVADRLGPWIIDDHSPFQELKVPSILLIDYDYKPWHTHADTPDRCSAESLQQVGATLWAALARLDAGLAPVKERP